MEQIQTMYSNYLLYVEQGESNSLKYLCCAVPILVQSGHGHRQRLAVVRVVIGGYYNIIINTRISSLVTIVTRCHNCDEVCHNCDTPFVKMLELGSEIIPKN